MSTEEVLQQCIIDGLIVRLPDIHLDRKEYLAVAQKLEYIGGKWKGGKTKGFVFLQDPKELLQQIANGEKRNVKKETQFFPTPQELANKLVADLYFSKKDKVLEPSAGRGALVEAIIRKCPEIKIDCYELDEINKSFLVQIPAVRYKGNDFLLNTEREDYYDYIIANPPFAKNQDIEHIRLMFKLCKPGGTIITIASKHWQFSSNKKEVEFKNWLEEIPACIEEIPAGAFKESGTNISACIIKIEKPYPPPSEILAKIEQLNKEGAQILEDLKKNLSDNGIIEPGLPELARHMSWEAMLGRKQSDMPDEVRRQRWEKWKELAIADGQDGIDAVEWWTKTADEGCTGCKHRDFDWCKLQELPCTVNPILTMSSGVIGMA